MLLRRPLQRKADSTDGNVLPRHHFPATFGDAIRLSTDQVAPRSAVSIAASTDMPGRTSVPKAGSTSSTILTGIRCTTLVKLPVALSGARSAKMLPAPGDQLSTWPESTRAGKA